MITSIGAWFDKQIVGRSDLVTRSYDMFVHRVRIKNNTIQEIMVDDVIAICNSINDKNKGKATWNELKPQPEAIKALISSKFSSSFNPRLWDNIFQDSYKAKLHGAIRGAWTSKTFTKGANYNLDGSSKQLTMVFAEGMVNIRNKYKAESKGKTSYSLVLATTRRVYGNLLKKIRKEIIAKAKKGNLEVDASGTSQITSEYLLIRGHGITIEGGAKPSKRQSTDETGKADPVPTTTAMLKVTDALEKQSIKLEKDTNMSGSSIADQVLGAAMEKVVESYKNVLEEQYSLKKFVNSTSDLSFDEGLIIEMEIISRGRTGSGIMAQDAMQQYDAAWLKINLRTAVTEVIRKKLPKAVRNWPLIAGSPTKAEIFKKQTQRTLIEELVKSKAFKGPKTKKGGIDLRFKVNKQLLKTLEKDKQARKKASKGTYKTTTTKGLKKQVIAGAASSYKAKNRVKKHRQAGARAVGKVAESPIALRNLLNEALPQTVAMNMGSPALNYRTGRFANSARVENVAIGPKGGTAIDYTYMKFPYQTFEPGGKQGSTQRDPRKIIGESIRELAVGILGRMPHTVRRT